MAIWTVMSAIAASALDVPSLVLARPHLHLRWIVPISRWTLLSGVVLLVFSLLSWRRVASALGWRRKPTLLTLLALTMALSLTLSPRDWLRNHRSLHQCLPSDWAGFGHSMLHVGTSVESLLNIVLLMPLGYGLVVASRRAVWPSVLMVTLPAAIELLQVIIPGRECSPSDWAANALGGLIGVVAGVLVSRRLRRARHAREDQRETMVEA
jgi:VanZ family protein